MFEMVQQMRLLGNLALSAEVIEIIIQKDMIGPIFALYQAEDRRMRDIWFEGIILYSNAERFRLLMEDSKIVGAVL